MTPIIPGGIYEFDLRVLAKVANSGYNVILVKYDPDGNALWARTTTAGSGSNVYRGVCADQAGNVYAVGDITGTAAYGFGPEVNAAGASPKYNSLVLVKYKAE